MDNNEINYGKLAYGMAEELREKLNIMTNSFQGFSSENSSQAQLKLDSSITVSSVDSSRQSFCMTSPIKQVVMVFASGYVISNQTGGTLRVSLSVNGTSLSDCDVPIVQFGIGFNLVCRASVNPKNNAIELAFESTVPVNVNCIKITTAGTRCTLEEVTL